MKKTVVMMVVIAITIFYFYSKDKGAETTAPSSLSDPDLQAIEKSASKIETDILEKIDNYSIDDQKLANDIEETKILKHISKLQLCLRNDLCGIKPAPNDPYFNPENTKAHRQIERSLELLALKSKDKFKNLTHLLNIPNENIQNLIIENISVEQLVTLLGKTEKLKESSYANFYIKILESEQGRNNQNVVIKLSEDLKILPPYHAIILIENLGKVNTFKPQSLKKIASSFCRFKRVQHNWKIISYEINNLSEKHLGESFSCLKEGNR